MTTNNQISSAASLTAPMAGQNRLVIVGATGMVGGFLDMTRRAIGIKHTVAGYYSSRMQGLDFVERAQPLAPSLSIALGEVEVRVVVNSISRHHQADRRRMQRSGMHRVGVAKVYYLQFFSLKVEGIAFEDLRRYQRRVS
jgi:hypothetical protein